MPCWNVKNLRHWITPSKITRCHLCFIPGYCMHGPQGPPSWVNLTPPPPALPVESEGYTVTPWFIWKSPLWMKRKIILKSNRFMTFQNVEKKIWGVSKAHFEIFVQLRLGSCLNTVTIKNGFPSLDCWFPVTPPQPWLTPNLLRTWGGINPQITAVFSKQRTGFFVANVGKGRRLHPLQKY